MTMANRREFVALAGATILSGCTSSLANGTSEEDGGTANLNGGLQGPWPTYGQDFRNTRHRDHQLSFADDAAGQKVGPAPDDSKVPPIIGPDARYRTVGGDSWNVVSYEFDGTRRWINESIAAYSPPTLYGRTLFVSRESETAALDAETGDVYWRQDFGTSSHDTSPLVADGTVFFHESSLVALNAETGNVKWRSEELPALGEGTAIDDQRVYVTVGDNGDGGLAAFDRATGETAWSATEVGEIYYPPVVGDGAVFVLDTESRLHRLTVADGTVEWTTAFDSTNQRPGLALAEDTLFVTEGSGAVHAVDATDGTTLWTDDRGLSGPPLVCGETVYVYEDAAESANATISALAAGTGGQVARYRSPGDPVSPLVAADDCIYYVGEPHEGTYHARAVFAVGQP